MFDNIGSIMPTMEAPGRIFMFFCATVLLYFAASSAKDAEEKKSLGWRQVADALFGFFTVLAVLLLCEMYAHNSRDFFYGAKSWLCVALWGIAYFAFRSRTVKPYCEDAKFCPSIIGAAWATVTIIGLIVALFLGFHAFKTAPRTEKKAYDDFCVELITQHVGLDKDQIRIGIGDGRLLFYYKDKHGNLACIDVPTESVTPSKVDSRQHGCGLPCLERNRTEYRYWTHYNGKDKEETDSVGEERTYTLYFSDYDSLPGDCRGIISGDDGSTDNAA